MLTIFDLDGTLVETYGELVLPGVEAKLLALAARGDSFAVATNQAGPAWRSATGDTKFPDPADLGARLSRIARKLSVLLSVPWYVAIGDGRLMLLGMQYKTIAAAMAEAAGMLDLRVSADLSWRKPEPGMLCAACAHYQVPADETVFVGDSPADAGAAKKAGVHFVFTDPFFAT